MSLLFLFILLVLATAVLPLLVIALSTRTFPTIRLVLFYLLPFVVVLGPLFADIAILSGQALGLTQVDAESTALWDKKWFWTVVCGIDVGIFVLSLVDLSMLPGQHRFSVQRELGKSASIKQKHPVEIRVNNHSGFSWVLRVKDEIDQDLTADPEEFEMKIDPQSRAILEYELVSSRRGKFEFQHVYLEVRSTLGLWKRYLTYPVPSTMNVYPDLKQVSEYALLARQNRLSLLGVRKSRNVGGDNEFERLRDYTRDDQFKHIDWRTTARRNKLTVRQFQTEQSQRLIFLIDCGRMMTNQAGDVSLLDHAFNSMLMLSYIALSHGDQVGLLAFSDEIHAYVPLGGGRHHVNRLLHSCFDLFPRMVESRYDQAFLYLSTHCPKRALVVLMTNVIDEVNANQVEMYLSHLVGKHLPLGVLLRDRRVYEFLEQAKKGPGGLFQAAAAATFLLNRQRSLVEGLERRGVLTMDVFPEGLTTPLINQYLDIKARHLL